MLKKEYQLPSKSALVLTGTQTSRNVSSLPVTFSHSEQQVSRHIRPTNFEPTTSTA